VDSSLLKSRAAVRRRTVLHGGCDLRRDAGRGREAGHDHRHPILGEQIPPPVPRHVRLRLKRGARCCRYRAADVLLHRPRHGHPRHRRRLSGRLADSPQGEEAAYVIARLANPHRRRASSQKNSKAIPAEPAPKRTLVTSEARAFFGGTLTTNRTTPVITHAAPRTMLAVAASASGLAWSLRS
jgi:hypothetical protein